MTTTMNLKSVLKAFLREEKNIIYPVIESTILHLNPLKITDDFQNYFDVTSNPFFNINQGLQEVINNELEDTPGACYKLILKQWHFSFKKIPNCHDFYFDIIAPQFEILETRMLVEVENLPNKVLEDEEVRFYFEERKRREIENLLKMNMRIKTTPSKSSLMKESYSTASNFGGKITPVYAQNQPFPHSFSRLMTPGKFSVPKSRGKESPMPFGIISNPFYAESGIKRGSNGKKLKGRGKFLSIEELMDVPKFVPIVYNLRVVREIPRFLRENWTEKKGADFSFGKKMNKELKAVIEEEDLQEDEITIDEIKGAIKRKIISWDDVEFNKECLNYLERNIHVLD